MPFLLHFHIQWEVTDEWDIGGGKGSLPRWERTHKKCGQLTVIVVIITITTILKTPSDQTFSPDFLYHSNHPRVSSFYRWEPSNVYWLRYSSTVSRNTHSCRRMPKVSIDCHIPKPVPFYCCLWKYSFPTQTPEPGHRTREHRTHGAICIKLCRLQRHSQIFLFF